MKLYTALEILDMLGSAEDPITYRKHEAVPNDLPYMRKIGLDSNAKKIRIGYWTLRRGSDGTKKEWGAPKFIRGTLYGMILDRINCTYCHGTDKPRRIINDRFNLRMFCSLSCRDAFYTIEACNNWNEGR